MVKCINGREWRREKNGGGFNGRGRVRIAGCANVTSRLLPLIDRGEGKAIQGCYVN